MTPAFHFLLFTNNIGATIYDVFDTFEALLHLYIHVELVGTSQQLLTQHLVLIPAVK